MEDRILLKTYENIKKLSVLKTESFIQDLEFIDSDKKNILFYLKKVCNSNTRKDLKESLCLLLDVILKNTSITCNYKSPIIWVNYALESKSRLKTAELVQWKEGYTSDQYSEEFDAIKILQNIVYSIFYLKQMLKYENSSDEIWSPFYKDETKFCGNDVIGEIWIENMPLSVLKTLEIKFKSALKINRGRYKMNSIDQYINMAMPINSYITYNLFILALKLTKESNISLINHGNSITFGEKEVDGDLFFLDPNQKIIVKTRTKELVAEISILNLVKMEDRFCYLINKFKSLTPTQKTIEFKKEDKESIKDQTSMEKDIYLGI